MYLAYTVENEGRTGTYSVKELLIKEGTVD